MHTLLFAGSAVLACVQLACNWRLRRKDRTGWVLSVAANVIAIPYDALTVQYGFIPVAVFNLWLAVRAWTEWRVT